MNILNIFRRKESRVSATTVQTRESYRHPFNILDKYIPLKVEYDLYKTMREAIPILDTAINRIVRLVGTFEIECDSDKNKNEIDNFLSNIKVNSNQKGINAFIQSYLDQLIECGNSSGEIVLNNAKNDIYALKNVDIRTIKLKETDNPLENVVCQVQPGEMEPVELPYQDLILFTPLNPEGDSPYGVSLFRSMPFMTNILLKIFNSMGTNWDRFGNVRYSVTYKPNNEILDANKVQERMRLIEQEFAKAMQDSKDGKVRDFIGVGDIQIKVIGADNQILDSEVPVRQILEQLVAKTGLPPFLLGLSWSTTERMSQQQADFLTSELENYRKIIAPVVQYIIDKWQVITGRKIPYEIVFEEINLQDLVEIARADLLKQQAREKEINNVIRLRNENIINQQIAAEELGYEEPVGEPPKLNIQSEENQDNKSIKMTKGIQIKSPFDAPPEDEGQYSIEQDTYKAYFEHVKALENKILKIIPEEEQKEFSKVKGLPQGYEDKVKKAVEEFVKEMIGEGSGNSYGTYGTYLLHAFGYGTVRANRTTREEYPDLASQNNKVIANYNHPYVQELLKNGLERIKGKALDKKNEIIQIMAEHASVGDNPVEWARTLRRELKNSITGESWYWERLARSESAMAIDRAEMAEYEAEGFGYCEWSAAPDACHICQSLHGQMWPISEAPKVVEDTHPHCRCRKKPRTKRQYDEYVGSL